MFTCAHCGASLQSPKQVCARCNGESPLVLPTLQGFGEEVLDDGVKTLLSPRSEGELRAIVGGDVGHTDDFAATANLVSPIPSMPKIDAQVDAFSDQKSFLSDTETEVISHHRNKHTLEGLNSEDAEFTMSEEEGLSIEDLDLDQEPKELLQSSSVVDLKVSTTPPPIPPPMQSIGGTHLKGLENPFKQSKPGELKKSYQALWLSSRGKHRKSALNQGGAVINPYNDRKCGTVNLLKESFVFDDRFVSEVWRPLSERGLLHKMLTLRSANAVIRLVEMTIAETEVISQVAVAIWQIKPSQEQVFYGAYNLFTGISRVGGGHCEISLPFVQSPSPLFTLECDPNGDVWCLPNGGQELWSLVQSGESIPYGKVLATQGRLFTVIHA